jgi:ADP-heptose:LPS heptosyltransferase
MSQRGVKTSPPLRLSRPDVPPALPGADIAPDCRHYRGDKPCLHNRLCRGCIHYAPYSHRLCIIKLAALGDVIRTLCILPELRRLYPAAHITWVSQANGCRMLAGHAMIDRVLPFDALTSLVLGQESFDTLINLDKEPQPCALAMTLFARRKLGIGLSTHGTPIPLNAEAHAYFHLGLSDELKFRQNAKSYPRLVYEALGLTYRGQRYELPVQEGLRDRVRLALAGRGWQPGRLTLGINVGAGKVFANKMWPVDRLLALIQTLQKKLAKTQIVLLGGPEERPIIDRVLHGVDAPRGAAGILDGGTEHEESAFVALVDTCDAVVCGDTMAMHVAIALGKPVVAFFGPTCEQEIDLFGKGEKLVARPPCSPCYKRVCDHDNACVQAIPVEEIAVAVGRVMAAVAAGKQVVAPLRKAG